MKCVRKTTQRKYAAKIFHASPNIVAEIEAYALKLKERHAHIVSIEEVIRDDKFIYVITEWVDGIELVKFAQSSLDLDRLVHNRIFQKIVKTASWAVSRHIHLDLKPNNIFIMKHGENYDIKIVDFRINLPECSYESSHYSWSLGNILYILLTAEMPFSRSSDDRIANQKELEQTIKNRIASRDIKTGYKWKNSHPDAKKLIFAMLTADPSRRIKLSVSVNLLFNFQI